MEQTEKIRAFKGFNTDLTCRGFQYQEGNDYTHHGDVRACSAGFHACEHPLDCFSYYAPGSSVYHAVELSGKISRDDDDTKIAASHIRIGARLDIAHLCKATFDYVRSRCTNENNAEPGKPATAGDCGAAASRGSSASGTEGLSVARGNDVRVRGGLGAVLVIVEEKSDSYDIKEWAAAVVDGVDILPDTWYRVVNGKFEKVA